MKLQFISPRSNRRLLLIFAGWGMDAQPFSRLAADGYDIAVAWDYRTEDFDYSITEGYDEIAVVAWSFGVPTAARFLVSNPSLPISSRIAINGTRLPVDNLRGIPEAIFAGTLDGLTETTLTKFYRRMAGSSAAFQQFTELLPDRDIDGLKAELRAIALRGAGPDASWDLAVVSDSDRIIPPENQRRAWEEDGCRIMTAEGAHLPDFQQLITRLLTDKPLVAARFRRAGASYDANADVQHFIAGHLAELWTPDPHSHPDTIEIGGGTGRSTSELLSRVTPSRLRLWDFNFRRRDIKAEYCECDAEAELMKQPDSSADVIFSASTVQWFNSLPAFFRNAARVLRPGGHLVVSTFGERNFEELRAIIPVITAFPSLTDIRAMLPDSLHIEVAEESTVTLDFSGATEVLRHISRTGVNAVGPATSPAVTRAIIAAYPLSQDGRALLTYHPVYLILRKV